MTSPDQGASGKRRDSILAFSIMFFAVAVLCLLLGWAEGVRKDTTYLHIPENGGWLIATGILAVFGFVLFIWSRGTKRS
ncbi:MAG: hypothetical protein ACR2MW_11545 [Chthoniobacterales bacterium]